jgi:hypothetical protein
MKSQTDSCRHCHTLIAPGQSQCSCGRPTPYTSFADRVAYEAAQWREYKERADALAEALARA